MQLNPKVALVILDGWGLGEVPEADAIQQAKTPFFDKLMKERPNATLTTFGPKVGLPDGQMGNSEVGHLNLGAGRVIYQDLLRINNAIVADSLKTMPVIKKSIEQAVATERPVHLFGLLSDGGVHSHIDHLKALVDIYEDSAVKEIYIHVFTDGRDTDPLGGLQYLAQLEEHLQNKKAKIASVVGRYYAMDRDNRWERIKLAYDLMVNGIGEKTQDISAAISHSYEQGVTDEFLKPIVNCTPSGEPIASLKNGDIAFCFNFRTDRPRQITLALSQKDFPEFEMEKLDLFYVTMTNYNSTFKEVNVVFPEAEIVNTLGEVLANNGKTQLRAAETEKYPHVTFFFSGGKEVELEGESRILLPSPKVATYDLKPSMSAVELAEKVSSFILSDEPDCVILNFANPDMVGHTGDFKAVKQAVEVTDACLKKVAEAALERNYSVIVIADHGNADYMFWPDGRPHTAHTTNKVPIVLIDDKNTWQVSEGKLADIAPTILHLLNIKKPKEMTGNVLVSLEENKMEMDLLPLLEIALKEDIGDGDHSSLSCIPEDAKGRARCLVKDEGVLAGVELARVIFELVDPEIEMEIMISDGAFVQKGDVAFFVSGKRQSLLKAERLVLNFMQRMSGIATKTSEFVHLVKGTNAKLLDTRKTTPGLRHIEKWAVRIGGGHNHRMGLYDMIMLKDNHVDFAGGIEQAITKTRKYLEETKRDIRVEIEVRNEDELQQVLQTGGVDRIMLDNFSPERIKAVIESIPDGIEVEASGGITKETLRSYAETGVDFISVGALTHSFKSMDISLKAIDPA